MKVTTITAKNLHRTVGRDSKGVLHALKPQGPNRNGDIFLVTRCLAEQWDTIDMIEGFPNCVRCMCSTR